MGTMSRCCKILAGLLVASLAICALSASVSSASSFTAEGYPAHLLGSDIPGEPSVYTGLFGIALECGSTSYTAEITAPSSSITTTPELGECHSGKRGATVTANECHYVLHDPEEVAEDEFSLKTDISCPAGKKIEIHIYGENENPHKGEGLWCTLTVSEQAGLKGLKAVNETASNTIALEGTLEGITSQTHGTCSAGLTINSSLGKLDAHATLTGVGPVNDPVDVG
jgi:hypothetical protein